MKKLLIVALALLISTQTFAQTRDYASLQDLLIKFYGYQRAGLKSGSCYNLNSGFANASHGGDSYNSNPLDGGWYDAGDYIKFGMNLGYAVYCLLKGYDVFPTGYSNKYDWTHQKTDDIPDILNQAKFATDYMIKAVINETTIVLDVGKAEEEHSTWGVTNASGRTGDKILLCNGADIPATYAACLALMATVYRKYDAAYADQCVAKAKVAFTYAKNKYAQGESSYYCTAQRKAGQALYDYPTVDGKKTQQVNDRMVAAGVELYRATSNADPSYKTWAQKGITDFYNCIGFAYIGPLAAFEVWRQGLGSYGALASNVGFIEGKIKASGPFNGVYQNSGWGTAREIGSCAFEYALAYVTTASTTSRELYLKRVKSHVDWVAGYSGTRSYICGFNNGPTKIHYRSTNYGPVPGGVVSGPDGDGNWANDGSAQFCEVAVDYNAGIIGALAFLKALESSDGIKMSTAFSATPTSGVDLTKNTVKFTAGFSKSVAWTIKIDGASGLKTLKGTGTSISETWDGSADKGVFIGGESVVASLSIDGTIVIFDVLKANPVTIAISQVKKIAPAASDVLLDDFSDSNLATKHGGNWIAIGNKTGISATTARLKSDTLEVSGSVYENGYAGVKATFNTAGTAGNFGQFKSILFDLRSTKSANVRVELEQPSITDSAYYGINIPVRSTLNRYRVDIKDFVQPDWKKSEKALDLSNISSLRFTVYDPVSSVKLYIDNVYIDGLTTGVVNVSSKLLHAALKPAVQNGSFVYSIPQNTIGKVDVSVFNIAGKVVMKEAFNTNAGKVVSIPLSKLSPGLYTVTNTVNGKVVGEKMKFVHSK